MSNYFDEKIFRYFFTKKKSLDHFCEKESSSGRDKLILLAERRKKVQMIKFKKQSTSIRIKRTVVD